VSADINDREVNAGLDLLQERGATKRCIQMVLKRAEELATERAAELDRALRAVNVPGFRAGKVPPARFLAFAAREPGLERWLFRHLFRFWTLLYAGLPEAVVDVAKKALPGIDFSAGEWSTIAEAVPAITGRMPRHSAEDVLLALYTYRFPAAFSRLYGPGSRSEHYESDGESKAESNFKVPITSDGTGVDKYLEPEQTSLREQQLAIHQPDHAEIVHPVTSPEKPESYLPVHFAAILSQLQATAPTSKIWDTPLQDFLDTVAELHSAKLAARAVKISRASIEGALISLRTPALSQELEFLQLRRVCDTWRAETASSNNLELSARRLQDLITNVEAYRAARIGAQNAANDSDFETWTTRRQEVKKALLALVAELGSTFDRASHAPLPGEGLPDITISPIDGRIATEQSSAGEPAADARTPPRSSYSVSGNSGS